MQQTGYCVTIKAESCRKEESDMYRFLALISTPALLPTQKDGYEITLCQDAETAAGLLMQKYDGLILNLFLPGRDGLTLLEQMHDQLLPVVLVLTRLLTPYIIQSAESLCGGYILRIPCSDREIAHRLEDMLQKFDSPAPDVSTVFARYHLQRLNLSAGKGFYRMMEILPGFNPKRDPCLFSDFYPSLAKRDSVTVEAIDNSIHRAIQQAYDQRNEAVWKEYFPDTSKCPKNKAFLSAVAARMRETDSSV